jgi:tetratricopeptide (TPR) repeat protein
LGGSLLAMAGAAALLPSTEGPMAPWLAGIKTALAFAVLLIFPGWLLAATIQRRLHFGRAEAATAFGLSLGLWLSLSSVLQLTGASLTIAGAVTIFVTAGLVGTAAVRTTTSGNAERRPPLRTKRRLANLLELALFWSSVLIVLVVFFDHAAIWRPTDRWTYAGILRTLLDSDSLQPGALAPNIPLNPRLDLSPWLVQMALLVRLSGVEMAQVYSYYVPPLLLVLALCAAYGLGRAVLGLRWAAALAVAVLAIAWLADVGVPALAAFPWQERMLLRIEGGEASVGQWALLGRIIEDKFLLLFVLLPVGLTWMWRYFLHGGRRYLLTLAVLLAGIAVVHPLGVVYYAFGLGGFAFLRCVQRPMQPILRRGFVLLVLLGVAAAVPALQTVQQRAVTAAAGAQPLRGQAFLDLAIDYGLWAATWSEYVYAAHPGLLLRREWLLVASVLLLLLAWRGVRRPAWQFLAGSIGAVVFIAFNPLLAPWLAALISHVFLPRMAWPLLLPGALALALAAKSLLASLRLRWGTMGAAWGPMTVAGALLLVLGLASGQRIVLGLGLLDEIQAAGLQETDREVLHFLRGLDGSTRIVLAEEWLTNELPAFAGRGVHGLAFRGKDSAPGGYMAMRDFYDDDSLDATKLQVLDRYGVDLAVVPLGSALDVQLGQLRPGIARVYENSDHRVYALAEGWQRAGAIPQLLAAAQAQTAGDSTEAALQAEAALRLAEQNVTARQVLAASLALEGQHTKALAAIEPLRATWGDQPWFQQIEGNIYRLQGAIRERQGKELEETAAAYQEGWAADPANLVLGQKLATLDAAGGGRLLAEDERQAMIETFAAAAAPRPGDLSYLQRARLWALADVYELLGEPAAAEATYRAALALTRPGDTEGEAAARLGRYFVRQGRIDEAQALYTWALERNPNAPVLYAAMADLAVLRHGPEAGALVWQGSAATNPRAPWPYVEAGKLRLREALDAFR